MELFVHTTSGIAVADIAEGTKASELVEQVGAPAGASVWVQDAEKPLTSTAIVTEAVGPRGHVHITTCKKVTVRVRFGGDDETRSFPPSATVQAVFQWASGPKGFNLPAQQKASHDVGVCDTGVLLDRNTHVGSVATECSVCLDLAPRDRFQG